MVIFRFRRILVIFLVLGVYFGHFMGFGNILVIFRFWRYFGHFLDFDGILVIFWILGIFWSFLKILEYYVHFHFCGILVILIIG